MKNWLSILVLVSFVRLQFVCCCGSIDPGNLASKPCVSQAASCPVEVKHKCECSHHHAKAVNIERIDAKSSCTCQLCNQEHSHVPHLFASEHLQIVSNPNIRFESPVDQQALLSIANPLSDFGYARASWDCVKCLHNGIPILYEFGHLRI